MASTKAAPKTYMLFQLLQDKKWKKNHRGFRRPKGTVVWETAEMTKDGRKRVRVTRTERTSPAYDYFSRSYEVVGYLRPHTAVILVRR